MERNFLCRPQEFVAKMCSLDDSGVWDLANISDLEWDDDDDEEEYECDDNSNNYGHRDDTRQQRGLDSRNTTEYFNDAALNNNVQMEVLRMASGQGSMRDPLRNPKSVYGTLRKEDYRKLRTKDDDGRRKKKKAKTPRLQSGRVVFEEDKIEGLRDDVDRGFEVSGRYDPDCDRLKNIHRKNGNEESIDKNDRIET